MEKGRKLFNRFLAYVLAIALALTGISFQGMSVKAEEPGTDSEAGNDTSPQQPSKDGLIVYYDFVSENDQAAQIPDASRNGNIAEIYAVSGTARGKYTLVDANIYGREVKAIDLVGGDDGAFLVLPEGIISGCDAVTISTWVKLTTDNGYQRIWDFGSGTERYIDLLSDGWNEGLEGYTANINCDGSGEIGVSKGLDEEGNPKNIDKNRWVLTTVVMNGSVMSLYENGTLIGTKDTGITVKDLGATTDNFIAYSQWGDNPTTGQFAEFMIYNRALSADEIAAMYNVTDDGIIAADYAELKLGDTSAVMKNLKLPSKGVNGSDIAWTSQNKAITIGEKDKDGSYSAVVTRPANGNGDAKGTLTASISYGEGTTVTKVFDVTVAEEFSEKQIVEMDKAAAIEAVGSLSAVIQKTIVLPTAGELGSEITWSWEGTDGVIDIPAAADEDGNLTAQVNRPAIGAQNESGKLKAAVCYGQATENIELNVTVFAYRESIGIKEVAEVDVVTLKGRSPSLPNFVNVTRTDDSVEKMKVMWPAAIDPGSYSEEGEFTVTGEVIGEYESVTANVTVVDEEEVVKAVTSSSFDLNDISLDKIGEDGSILTQNRDRDIAYLKLLDNKRMLYDFYMTFGENDKIKDVKPLGGWDAPTGLLRGHSTGHYMSALALAYASTKDAELKTKLDEMISELHRLQQKSKGNAADFEMSGPTMQESLDVNTWSKDPNEWGEGFISAYSPDQFALLEVYAPYGSPGAGIWAPYYTLHKLLAGFLDAYTYTGNTEALATAKALGKWVYNRLSACSQEQLTKMWDMYIAGEFGGMNESLAQLYIYAKADGDADADVYLKAAKLFDNTTFFDNLVKNVDDIQGRHANQHIPQIIGAMKVYEATTAAGDADMYYYDIAENFWQMVVSRYAYSIGGVGTGEAFTDPYTQAASISGDRNCETCAAYNLMKLTKMLNNYDPGNAEYMDYYERTLYNQILASQTPNVTDRMHNGTTYMLPIGPGTVRDFGDDYNAFTCCHGTGMENHVKYQEAAYAKTEDTLYVGLYLPSTLTWEEKGVKVVQETAFPSETTKLTVQALQGATAQTFDMKLRVPYWAENGFTVKVNNETKMTTAECSSYVILTGIKANDVIEITMPFTLHLDKTPDTLQNMTVASVMYGPFVMPAQSKSTDWQRLDLPEHLEDYFTVSTNEANGFPILSGGGFNFAPMFAPEYATERYHTYFRVSILPDDGSTWYQVNVHNNTPTNGSISTNAKGAMIKGGTDLVVTMNPIDGFVPKKLVVNGEEVQDQVVDNVYTLHNVSSDLEIQVNFRPAVLDPKNLEYSATIASSRSNDNDNWYGEKEDVNRDWEPESSSGHAKGWVNWYTPAGSECYLWYTWDEPVTMNTFNIFWRVSPAGWMKVPGTLGISYKDEDGKWQKANMTTAYVDAVKINQYNTIHFDTITTTAVRLDMTINTSEEGEAAGCTGVYRWKVSNEGSSAVDPADKTKLAAAIAKAEALNESEYTEASWGSMQTALTEAKEVNDMEDASQKQVDDAEEALTAAINALQKIPVTAGVDKTKLAAAIDKVDALNKSEYTEASWNSMQTVLTEAKKVNESADATQDQVDQAEQDLTAAIDALQKVPAPVVVDKTKLAASIAKAGALKQSDYTEASWSSMQTALAEAQKVNDSADATQAQVDKAQKDLDDAVAKLEKKTTPVTPPASQESVKKLTDAVTAAGTAYKQADYTPESWKAFTAALEAAKKVMADPSATQAQVDAAQKNLTDAIAKLTKQQTEAPKPPTVKKSKLTLGVKETSSIYKKGYTYSTSNKKYVTVSKKGVVKGVRVGKATVTVKNASGQKIQTYTVTVKKAPNKINKVSPTKKTLRKGKSCTIKVTLPKGTASKITFTSSNKKVATVSAKGVVKAKKKGQTTITVKTFNKKSKKVKITVK